MRVNTEGKVSVVVGCIHCGEAIEDVNDGLAVLVVRETTTPGKPSEETFEVDYAHEDCEDAFLSELCASEGTVARNSQLSVPLAKLLDALVALRS
jgi:hypothetical protein